MSPPDIGRDPLVVGVLGGTFDPVHLGHLHAAEAVLRVFSLARVLLVPCAIPPHKVRPDLAPAPHRLEMLSLAVAGREGLVVSTIELDRGGVSYTIHTLRALREGTPPLAPLLILGMDALMEIESWFEHEALLREFDLVAVDRPDAAEDAARGSLPASVAGRLVRVEPRDGAAPPPSGSPPGAGGRVYRLAIPPVPVSSSRVRARAAAGDRLDGLVPESVARYIRLQGLYRQEESR